MLFDQLRELPVATLRRAPRARIGLILGDLQRWLTLRWQWFRPRTVPVLVAMLGMVALLQSVSYLAHSPAPPAPTGDAVIDGGPRGATIEAMPARSPVSFHIGVRLVPVGTR